MRTVDDLRSSISEGERRKLRIAQGVFILFFLGYLLFPNDEEFRAIGLGTPGSRVLILDIFVLLMLVATASAFRRATHLLVRQIGFLPLVLFLGMYLFSLFRGLPIYGGFAIGEGRWYASIVLMPAAYAV